MEIATVGIDLGKTVFHPVALKPAGETMVRKKFSRARLLRFTGNLKVGLIGMEACAGGPLSWPRTARTGARSAADARAVSQALREDVTPARLEEVSAFSS
jgi:hypothetical protein